MPRLVVVEDAFLAQGPGTVVAPRFIPDSITPGTFAVRLRFPDGAERLARASYDVMHMRGPSAPYAMVRVHGVAPEELPAGTEIWSVDEARASGATGDAPGA